MKPLTVAEARLWTEAEVRLPIWAVERLAAMAPRSVLLRLVSVAEERPAS